MQRCLIGVLTLLLVAINIGNPSALFAQGRGKAKTETAVKEPSPTPFSRVVRAHFKKWDLDSDGKLTTAEIHAAMIRPRIKGDEAAAVAVLRCVERYAYTRYEGEMPPFTLADLKRYEAAGPDGRHRLQPKSGSGHRFRPHRHGFHSQRQSRSPERLPDERRCLHNDHGGIQSGVHRHYP
jgi:hypothetical protein